jgi:hypothetical protein
VCAIKPAQSVYSENPEDWNDLEVRTDLVVPDPSDPSSDEGGDSREGEEPEGGEMQGKGLPLS